MTDPIKIINKSDLSSHPNQEKIWDEISKPWKTYYVKKIPAIVEFLKNKKGKVIDLGCGTARNMIANPNLTYTGIDFSAGQIEQAHRQIKKDNVNAKFIKADLLYLHKLIKPNSFDYGLFISTLHCIETKEQRLKILKTFYKSLKSGAQAIITTWDSTDNRFKGFDKDIYMSWKEDGIPYMRYYYLYDKKELIDLLKSVGFKILKIYKSTEHDRFSKKNLIIKIKKH